MKAIFTLLAVAVVGLVGCQDDKGGKLDPEAKVYISPAAGVAMQTVSKVEGYLTAHEIVKQAEHIKTAQWGMDLGDWNRDLVKNRFNVGASWVIGQYGDLTLGFIEARDYIFVIKNDQNLPKDTIAYIPNAVMKAVEQEIKAAYAAKNYTECYRLLQEGFVFKPTTGKEWLELKAKGEN